MKPSVRYRRIAYGRALAAGALFMDTIVNTIAQDVAFEEGAKERIMSVPEREYMMKLKTRVHTDARALLSMSHRLQGAPSGYRDTAEAVGE